MRNLIIGISLLFIAIVAVSYFYFSNLDENTSAQPPEIASDDVVDTAAVEAPVATDGVLWTFGLNGGAIIRPSVHRFGDSTRFILVQDAYHILHAISADGHKLWNAQLPGPILDSISQLPDHTLVFTTAERLYRIDTEGDPLTGFSLKLPQRATRGAVATDDGGAVRIEVGTNRQLLSYDGRGKLLRRQAGSRNTNTGHTDPSDRLPDTLPNGCGPLAYVGPLHNDGQRYLLCSKNDRQLYCFLY